MLAHRAGPLAAWLALGAVVFAPALAAAQEAPALEPDVSIALEAMLGGGRQWGGTGARGGVLASGFALLVRYRAVSVGPVVIGSGVDQQDAYYLGVDAGLSWEPARWARLRALVEAGTHRIDVVSEYAGFPPASARLGYVGARLSALAYLDVQRDLLDLFARRLGLGLEAAVRADLQQVSIQASVPPDLGVTPASVDLGGTLASLALVAVIEW